MSQCAQEILAAAWPEHPVQIFSWDDQWHTWHEAVPWNPDHPSLRSDSVIGDPLPLMAILTDGATWIVPAMDHGVWWWIQSSEKPHQLPIVMA